MTFGNSILATALVLGSIVMFTADAFSNTGPPFDGCDSKEEYYATLLAQSSNPSDWSEADIRALINETHRQVLPSVPEEQDGVNIIMALRALWPGETFDTVRVIYRDIDFPSNIANTQLGWEREDLWPRGRGWDIPEDVEAWTDVHAKAPADSTVRVKKDKLFFGSCGTVERIEACVSPATTETANTTEMDDKIFAPPDRYKGDVARALFYMAARYQESLNLTLTDCPPFEYGEFGYLSELLTWHELDPVSEEELNRTTNACRDWQGNRNPFVDYPELVASFYPDGPDQLIADTFTYSRCTAPTPSPTAMRVACNDLEPGDLPIFLMNSNDPDQVVFVPLVDIPQGVGVLYLTDNAWNGTAFIANEGTMKFTIPPEGLPAGQVFGLGEPSPYAELWTPMEGSNPFDIQTMGDNLFIYCLDLDNLPNFLFGFTNNGPWYEPGLSADEYGSGHSALPESLAQAGSIFLSTHGDNCVYVGPLQRNMEKSELQETMIDPENFDCINGTRFQLDLPGVEESQSSAFMIQKRTTTITSLVAGLLAIAAAFIVGM